MGEASPLTPSQARFMQETKERRQRMAARAVPDTPLVCLGALARSAAAPVFEPIAPVLPTLADLPCEPWFYVIEEIEPPKILVTSPGSIRKIQAICCEYFDIPFNILISQRRQAKIVKARQVGMYLSKHFTTRSFPEIGRRFGNRDHTTVLYAVAKIERLEWKDEILARDLSLLRPRVREALQ